MINMKFNLYDQKKQKSMTSTLFRVCLLLLPVLSELHVFYFICGGNRVSLLPYPDSSRNDPTHITEKVIIDDPLLELSPSEFEQAYAKLPDDYELKVGLKKRAFFDMFFMENDVLEQGDSDIKTYTITKAQAEKITKVLTEIPKPVEMSFRGLRFFRNLERISIYDSSGKGRMYNERNKR